MSLPFTQYLPQDGETRQVGIATQHEYLGRDLIARGVDFECEILSTHVVSLTAEYEGETVAIELCDATPAAIKLAVNRLIPAAYRKVVMNDTRPREES